MDKHPELTPAEWLIMRVVWERREVLARDVHEALLASQGWAPTTVRTMMERLVKKGYLKPKKIGPVFLYRPAVAERDVVRRVAGDLLGRISAGGLADLVAYAVRRGDLSPDDLEQLERLIRERKEKERPS